MTHDPIPTAPRPNPWLVPILLVVLAGAGLFIVTSLRQGPSSAATGRKTDYNWDVTDLDGKPVALASFKGRPVFLNVWATWCPPCVAEMPSIAALASNPKLKDVAFVCISVDDDAEAVRRFLARTPLPMTILHAAGPAPALFETEGIPATFILAPDGVVARAEVGASDWNNPEAIALLERLSKSR